MIASMLSGMSATYSLTSERLARPRRTSERLASTGWSALAACFGYLDSL